MNKPRSNCCNDFIQLGGDGEEGTHYYVCMSCGKPCDLGGKVDADDVRKKAHIPETCAKKDEKGTHVESQQPDVQIDNFVRDVTMMVSKHKSWVRRNLLDIIHSQRKEAVSQFATKLFTYHMTREFEGGYKLKYVTLKDIDECVAQWEKE